MESSSTILALDIATTLGWCFSKGDRIIAWGVEDFRSKTDSIHAPGLRLCKFHDWLFGSEDNPNGWAGVDEVVYEQVGAGMRNLAANETAYAMLGLVRMFCARSVIPIHSIHNGTLKKEFAGHGGADKLQMCDIAHRLGWRGGRVGTDQDHDACDAVALIYVHQLRRGIRKNEGHIDLGGPEPVKDAFLPTNHPEIVEQEKAQGEKFYEGAQLPDGMIQGAVPGGDSTEEAVVAADEAVKSNV